MVTRMKPELRKAEILEAALIAAERIGFSQMRQADIATQAGCAFGSVTRYFNTMAQMRRAVMRAAVERKNIKLSAQGLGCGNPDARKAPEDIKKKALALLAL